MDFSRTPYRASLTRRRRLMLSLAIAVTATIAVVGSANAHRSDIEIVPSSVTAPTISGTARLGRVLTATTGTWDGTIPFAYTYQWQRCNSAGHSCSKISGATAAAYVLKSGDVGGTLRVEVTASNGHGATGQSSAASEVVEAGTDADASMPAPQRSPGCVTDGGTVAVNHVSAPTHPDIDRFQTTPATVTYATKSLTVHFHVSACGGSVQDALVYATAVPFGTFAVPHQQLTNAAGWVTLTLTALPGFPVAPKQQLIVMFVRANKPGEDVLGGVSGRRLVGVHVAKR